MYSINSRDLDHTTEFDESIRESQSAITDVRHGIDVGRRYGYQFRRPVQRRDAHHRS